MLYFYNKSVIKMKFLKMVINWVIQARDDQVEGLMNSKQFYTKEMLREYLKSA